MNPARVRVLDVPRRRVLLEALAVAIPAAVVLIAQHQPGFRVGSALLACAVLPFRHRWPRTVLLLCLPAVAGGLGWPPTIVAIFALGRALPRLSRFVPWDLLVMVSALTPVFATQSLSWGDSVLTVTFVVFLVSVPTALGALVATREQLRDSLVLLREATEAESAAKAETARAEERSRIAREIHDAVGHHVTLIAVEASALSATTTDSVAREKARRVRKLANEALNEMRVTLGLAGSRSVRADSWGTIPDLVERARQTGIDAELVNELDGAVELASRVGRAAYRVVQEGLTNASKHAPGAEVRVHLGEDDGALRITVRNGAPSESVVDVGEGGHGLAGLSERVRMVGGTLEAGPSEDGGYRLSAVLPREPG